MDAPTVIQSRVIGARLVETNLISDEQLERALELQEQNGHRLGQILFEEFGVSQLDFASVLAGHDAADDTPARPGLRVAPDLDAQASEPVEPLTPASVRIRRPIGEIFVENGFITSAQLEAALEVQQKTGARIGEILVEQGILTRLDLASALAEHWEPAAIPPALLGLSPVESAAPTLQGQLGSSAGDQDAIADLSLALTRLEETRAADAAAAEARLANLEEAAAMLAGLEERVRESVASALAEDAVPAPAEHLEATAAATAALEEQVAALAGAVEGVRAEVEVVASRPEAPDPGEQLLELADRIDRAAGEGQERIRFSRRLEELAGRIDGLVEREESEAATVALEERIAALAGVVEGVRAETEAFASRPEPADSGEQLLELSDRVERAAVEGREKLDGLAEDLGRRLAEVAGRIDGLVDRDEAAGLEERIAALAAVLDGVRNELEAVASRPESLGPRLEELAGRIDGLVGREESEAATVALEERIAALAGVVEGVRAETEAFASRPEPADSGEQLLELSDRVERAAVEGREKIDGLAEDLGRRLAEVAGRIDGLVDRDEAAGLEERVAALAAVLDGVRGEMETLANRPEAAEVLAGLDERVRESVTAALAAQTETSPVQAEDLEAAIAATASLEERIVGQAVALDAVRADIEALASRPEGLGRRLEELADRIDGLVDRDEAAGLEERIAALAGVVEGVRAETEAFANRPEPADSGEQLLELSDRVERAAVEGREKIDGLAEDLGRRLAEVAGRVDGLVGRDEAVAASRADRADLEARTLALDSQVRVQHDETAALRALVESSLGAAAGSTSSQESIERMLEERLERLESRLTVDTASAHADSEQAIDELRGETGSLAARIDEMLSLRHGDAQAARDSTEDLVDRLATIAQSVGDVEARYAARDESSAELEAALTALAARLDHFESSAPGVETGEVAAHVANLEDRVEALIAIGEEQARVTERAISTGLASLGKRVAGSKKKYGKRGKGRRRSIERLGAAVIEAGARLADQIPVSETEGCVAFAPTTDGYRLVELPGSPPKVGAKVKVKGCGGPLVVTRLGRSPLPFDARPCAYLDRA